MANIIEREIEYGRLVRAEVEGKPIGFGVASLDGCALHLENIHVEPPFRRAGYAREIFAALVSWGRENGAKTLTGEFKPEYGDQNVRYFYERMGVDITPDGMLYKNLT